MVSSATASNNLFLTPATSVRTTNMAPLPLPMEVMALKQTIRKTHPSKCFSFSLLHMRKMASPPVQIPAVYRRSRATNILVSGKQVPYTREMWMRRERAKPHTLECIHEVQLPTRRR